MLSLGRHLFLLAISSLPTTATAIPYLWSICCLPGRVAVLKECDLEIFALIKVRFNLRQLSTQEGILNADVGEVVFLLWSSSRFCFSYFPSTDAIKGKYSQKLNRRANVQWGMPMRQDQYARSSMWQVSRVHLIKNLEAVFQLLRNRIDWWLEIAGDKQYRGSDNTYQRAIVMADSTLHHFFSQKELLSVGFHF